MDEAGKAQTTIELASGKFPFVFRNAIITIEKLAIFVFFKKPFKNTNNQTTMKLWLIEAPPPLVTLSEGGGNTRYEPRDPDGPGTDPATSAAGSGGPAQAVAENMQGYRVCKMFKKLANSYLLNAQLVNDGKVQVGRR